MAEFTATTRNPGRFDFALIDGPSEKLFFASEAEIEERFRAEDGNPFGHRDDPAGLRAIATVTRDCEVMLAHVRAIWNRIRPPRVPRRCSP
jgi:hypothetical protein